MKTGIAILLSPLTAAVFMGFLWLCHQIAVHAQEILIVIVAVAAIAAATGVIRWLRWRYWNVATITSRAVPMPAAGRRP